MYKHRWCVGLAAFGLMLSAIGAGGCSPEKKNYYNMVPLPPNAPAVPPAKATAIDEGLRDSALAELLTEVDSNDPTLRSNALEALQQTSPPDAVAPALKGLSDPDPGVRFAACMVVGELKLAQAHDGLLRMHDDKDIPEVEVAVRFALHRLGDTRYSHDLEAYSRDTDPQIRGKTALVLGMLGEPSAADVLHPMRYDEDPAVRLQVASSLWLMGDEQGLEDLLAWAISKYPDDLILATLALAAPKDQRVIQHIRANLVTDYPEVDLAAARALGELSSDEGYTVATNGAASQDPRQRFLAALALGAIGRPDAQPILATLLKDQSPRVRIGAATAILQLH
ncbi:MAG: HEAT repeat domain-containing protein [Tepidisphaeraceae bacterium]